MILCSVGPATGALAVREIASEFSLAGHEVEIILERGARTFVGPGAFSCVATVVNEPSETPEALVFASATSETIARLAHGLPAGPASGLYLSGVRPAFVSPDLDTATAHHPAIETNLSLLREDGCFVFGSSDGMAPPREIVARVLGSLGGPLQGRRIVVTAGGTREPIDSVRFVGNRSSGKMGVAIAREASRMGADVSVVAANVEREEPGVRWVPVETVGEMRERVMELVVEADALIMAAAVSDFKPSSVAREKVRRSAGLDVTFVATEDILAEVRERNPDLFMVGFAATHGDPVPDAQEKLVKKGVDLVVGNDISQAGIGFGAEENEVYVVGPEDEKFIPRTSKSEIARAILYESIARMSEERQD